MFWKTRAFCKFAHIIQSIFCIVDVFSSMFFNRCFYIDVFSSMFLHRCFFIDVLLSMFFHRCFFIDGLLLEIELIFYHRCFDFDYRFYVYHRCFALLELMYGISLVPRQHPRGLGIVGTRLVLRIPWPDPTYLTRGLGLGTRLSFISHFMHVTWHVLWTWLFHPRGGVGMSMGDEREPDQSTKLKQAIDILSSMCSGSTSGTTSGDTSGGSSASRSGGQQHPDRSRARGSGKLLHGWYSTTVYIIYGCCNCCVWNV